MSTPVLDQCRAQLESHRTELQESINSVANQAGIEEIDPDIGSLTDSMRETLKDIEDALSKLSNGTYGECESCKGRISDERLVELPAARHCYECADAQSTVITAPPDID